MSKNNGVVPTKHIDKIPETDPLARPLAVEQDDGSIPVPKALSVFSSYELGMLPSDELYASFKEALLQYQWVNATMYNSEVALLTSEIPVNTYSEFFNLTLAQLMDVPVKPERGFDDMSFDELQLVAVVDSERQEVTRTNFGTSSDVDSTATNLQHTVLNDEAINSQNIVSLNQASSNLFSSVTLLPLATNISIFAPTNELLTQSVIKAAANIFVPDPPAIVYQVANLHGGYISCVSVDPAFARGVSADYSQPGMVVFTIDGVNGGNNFLIFFTNNVPYNALSDSSLVVNNPNPALNTGGGEVDDLNTALQTLLNNDQDLSTQTRSEINTILNNQNPGGPGGPVSSDVGPITTDAESDFNSVILSYSALGLPTNGLYYQAGDIAFVLGSPLPSGLPEVTLNGILYNEIKFDYSLTNDNGTSNAVIDVLITEALPTATSLTNLVPVASASPQAIVGSIITPFDSSTPNNFGENGGSVTNVSISGGNTVIGSNYIDVTDQAGNELIVNELTGQYVFILAANSAPIYDVFTYQFTDLHGHSVSANLTLSSPSIPPVVLDMTGEGIALTSAVNSPVAVDLNGTGDFHQIGWVANNDAVLMYNINGNGVLSSVNQISFTSYVPGATTDLQGLTFFDSNHNGQLDSQDADFAKFGVLLANGHYESLAQAGIASISLVSNNQSQHMNGNTISGLSSYQTVDGVTHAVADASFAIGAPGKGSLLNLSAAQASTVNIENVLPSDRLDFSKLPAAPATEHHAPHHHASSANEQHFAAPASDSSHLTQQLEHIAVTTEHH